MVVRERRGGYGWGWGGSHTRTNRPYSDYYHGADYADLATALVLTDQGRAWTQGVKRPLLRAWVLGWHGAAEIAAGQATNGPGAAAFSRLLPTAPQAVLDDTRMPNALTAWLWWMCDQPWDFLQPAVDAGKMLIFDNVLVDQMQHHYDPVVVVEEVLGPPPPPKSVTGREPPHPVIAWAYQVKGPTDPRHLSAALYPIPGTPLPVDPYYA